MAAEKSEANQQWISIQYVANRVKRVNTTINGNLKHAAELQQ
jgi:hypothetical protein